MDIGPGDGPRGIPGRNIGKPVVADLAGANQIVQRPDNLFGRCDQIPSVQHVEIDIVGPKPRQGCFDCTQDILAAITPRIGVAGREIVGKFGRQDDVVSDGLVGDEATDKCLAGACAVGIGRVDEIAAGLQIGVENSA